MILKPPSPSPPIPFHSHPSINVIKTLMVINFKVKVKTASIKLEENCTQ